jgi:hypothetical protein
VAAADLHTLHLARETEKAQLGLHHSKRCPGERARRMEGERGPGHGGRKPMDGRREYQLQVH